MDQPSRHFTDIESGFSDTTADQPPVYIVSPLADEAAELASALRDVGFRTRHFVSMDVLANAARQMPPGALVSDMAMLSDNATLQAVQSLRERQHFSLFLLAHRDTLKDRLAAVRAGGNAFFIRPVNVSMLAYRLQHLATGLEAPCSLAVLDDSEHLAGLSRELEQAGHPLRCLTTRPDLLSSLAEDLPDLLLVNGDMSGLNPRELLPALRQYPGLYSLPVLLLTGGDKRKFDHVAERAALDGIVGSNISPVDLGSIIRSRVQRARGLQASWRYLSRRDADSGLHSRTYFMEELRQALALARQAAGSTALLYATVAAAAEGARPNPRSVTTAVAGFLQHLLPSPALATHLQHGRFAALVYGQDDERLGILLEALRRRLNEGVTVPGASPLRFEARLGSVVLGPHTRSTQHALKQAQQAAGEETSEAGGTTETAPLLEREWKRDLNLALTENRFRLVYQPIASLTGQPTNLYEVFVRMLDDGGQDLLPQEFLPPAQRLGLTRHIDRWVILRALNVLAEQQERRDQPVFFIKLFAETLETKGFTAWLGEQIRAAGLQPDKLVFQLSQQAVAHRLSSALPVCHSLRDMGCALALEHYRAEGDQQDLLTRLPLNYVKISSELTQDMASNPEHLREIRGIASHARKAGLRTIAALIQDASTMSGLWGAGVDYIQGYFMQAPADVFGDEELAGTDPDEP